MHAIYTQLCKHLAVVPEIPLKELLPAPIARIIDLNSVGDSLEERLLAVTKAYYDIFEDDRNFRPISGKNPTDIPNFFRSLRFHYPERREYQHSRVTGFNADQTLLEALSILKIDYETLKV